MSDYYRPINQEAALEICAGGARVVAGTTQSFAQLNNQEAIVDISRIPDLHRFQLHEGKARIGAMTPWRLVIESDLPPSLSGLQEKARDLAVPPVRNLATVGGFLCGEREGQGLEAILSNLAARAEIHHRSAGRREEDLSGFLARSPAERCGPGELLTHLILPVPDLADGPMQDFGSTVATSSAERHQLGVICTVSAMINGEARRVEIDPLQPLADILGDVLGIASLKGVCSHRCDGGCSILLNGRYALSCTIPGFRLADSLVISLEGLQAHGRWSRIQQALARHGAPVCDHCAAPVIIAAADVLARITAPDVALIQENLRAISCNCGSHHAALPALLDADNMKDPVPPAKGEATGSLVGPPRAVRLLSQGNIGKVRTAPQMEAFQPLQEEDLSLLGAGKILVEAPPEVKALIADWQQNGKVFAASVRLPMKESTGMRPHLELAHREDGYYLRTDLADGNKRVHVLIAQLVADALDVDYGQIKEVSPDNARSARPFTLADLPLLLAEVNAVTGGSLSLPELTPGTASFVARLAPGGDHIGAARVFLTGGKVLDLAGFRLAAGAGVLAAEKLWEGFSGGRGFGNYRLEFSTSGDATRQLPVHFRRAAQLACLAVFLASGGKTVAELAAWGTNRVP